MIQRDVRTLFYLALFDVSPISNFPLEPLLQCAGWSRTEMVINNVLSIILRSVQNRAEGVRISAAVWRV